MTKPLALRERSPRSGSSSPQGLSTKTPRLPVYSVPRGDCAEGRGWERGLLRVQGQAPLSRGLRVKVDVLLGQRI